ncbi:hypothetical protein M2105_001231 [Paenibacillus sp. PastF-1]|nr:hypothetical protein [Paenibacillus sp. PastF-2]MDF9846814.1 hypothetical protein [Paenibacillus sp. PastM-2]MDF9853386.1 hypothetical protein [Paenibacillus sp. PastF-1]MDH6479127.1 hypothetical protein [Paenibacillus sp. PastH-2]MDH6506858.1 hypothetical protein [Paenibacillus sp. PastM-3]
MLLLIFPTKGIEGTERILELEERERPPKGLSQKP